MVNKQVFIVFLLDTKLVKCMGLQKTYIQDPLNLNRTPLISKVVIF